MAEAPSLPATPCSVEEHHLTQVRVIGEFASEKKQELQRQCKKCVESDSNDDESEKEEQIPKINAAI